MCFLIKDFRNYQESKTTFFIYLCSVHDLKQNQTVSVLSLPLASYDYIESCYINIHSFQKTASSMTVSFASR